MINYLNLSGNSGVVAYETEDQLIKIIFKNPSKIYVYSYIKPGMEHVENMKAPAVSGKGLSAYISKNVKSNYEYKLDL